MADTKNQQEKRAKPAQITKEKGKGTVKAVPSGDTVVVLQVDKSQQGLPFERTITLGSIQAPLLARKRNDKKTDKQVDEAFAWASREFLRKKAIGKTVNYVVEYKNPNNNKEYGVVTLANNDENLTNSIVAEGWAKVKRPNNPSKEGGFRPELQELITLEEEAQRSEKGIWNKDPIDAETAVRPSPDTNPAAVFDQYKGKPLSGVVDQVRTGSALKIILVPSFHEITLYLSGASAPEQDQNGQFPPFGREATFFTEHYVLHKDVTVILEGIDKYNFYGTVSMGNSNLAEELLKAGLARYVEWSGVKTNFNEKLKAAEKSAKDKSLRVWSVTMPTQLKPQTTAPQQQQQAVNSPKPDDKKSASSGTFKSGKEISGRVVEVINGGTIVVLDQGGFEHRINLSSIKVNKDTKPQLNPTSQQSQSQAEPGQSRKKPEQEKTRAAVERAYAIEAKEYLRRRLVGHRVKCVFDYTRPVPPVTANSKPVTRPLTEADRSHYSVYLDKNNVAVELTEQGLAQAAEHRGGEARSKDYELILMAEDRSKKSSKGVWAPDEKAPVSYVTDVTKLEPHKARQYLPYLKRNGRQRGVVDYEFSGSRFKIFVPKESAFIFFTVAAIRSPFSNRTGTDPYYKESVQFAREHIHQRDVEIEVLSQDKGGSFLGNLWINKKNYAALLLEEGLAETNAALRDSEHSTEYLIAEDGAKRAKKNLWKNYDEEAEKAKIRKAKEEYEEKKKPQSTRDVSVVVTEIVDGSNFYVQVVGSQLDSLDELMKNLAAESDDEPRTPVIGELVKAQFTADDAWYRARVTGATPDGEYDVVYIDYGNAETIPVSRIRTLPSEFRELPAQAHPAQLAYVKPPTLDEDYGQEAALFLRDLVLGKTLDATVEYQDNDNKLFLTLASKEPQVVVNCAIVRAGLARVEKVRRSTSIIETLKEEEDKAKNAHSYIWEYGDPGFDDEEERDTKGANKKAAAAPAKSAKGKQ